MYDKKFLNASSINNTVNKLFKKIKKNATIIFCKMVNLQNNTRLNKMEEYSAWIEEGHMQRSRDVIT